MEKVWAVTFYDRTDDSHDIFTICKTKIGAIKAIIRDIADIADEKYLPFGVKEISAVMTEFTIGDSVDIQEINLSFPDYAYYIEEFSVED